MKLNNKLRQGRSEEHAKRNEICITLAFFIGLFLTIVIFIFS
jgi:hypothetical protein